MPPLPPALRWQWSAFDALTAADLYAALQLRQRVFVVEQQCPYLDADGSDALAWHLFGWAPEEAGGVRRLSAYARIFAPGIKFAEASIGRVVSDPGARRTGAGRALMHEAVRRCGTVAPGSAIRIGAQLYLERFYEGFGFVRASDPYDEDGIQHIEMLRAPGA